MKNILGLDLGPSSIGWAVVNKDDDGNGGETYGRIVAVGSRIIPMDAAELGDFEKGNKQSGTADRRRLRSIRRLFERVKLRRSRLNRVLRILGFLPAHYAAALDRYGKFQSEPGCPLAWAPAEDGGYRFLFQDAFQEMVDDFRAHGALPADGSLKLPHDWTLYYLRRKALSAPVSREELAWVLLSFNQKRGYYQLRGEDEEEAKSSRPGSQFEEQVVQSVRDSGETLKGAKVLIVELADGRRGRVVRRDVPDWAGRRLSLIVTPDLDKKGQPRYDELLGGPGLRFKVPTEEEWDTEWALVKAKAEHDLDVAQTTVGAYIYEKLREAPSRKVRGQLVRTIDRRYYVEEARRIVEKQSEYHPELRDAALLETCLTELYPHNAAHRNEVRGGGWERLLVKDVLFYQRPLRSQKSLIADCPYERRTYYDRETGEEKSAGVKCIPRSHPLFQEFRLWQFLANLHIFQREVRRDGVLQTDVDVTSKLLPDDEAVCRLYDWLSTRKSVKQEDLLKWKEFGLGKDAANKYRWNYPEEREYPAGETRCMLLLRLKKAGIDSRWLTPEREEALWHLLYSVADPRELEKGLHTFARKQGIAEAGPEGGEQAVERFCAAFRNAPLPERDYGSYSAKALRKLLPLMRRGHHWDAGAVEPYRKRRDEVAEAVAAGQTLFEYLTTCAPEDYRRLWEWAYQGDSGQGMRVVAQDGRLVMEGYDHDERQHINRLPADALSPPGYELPSMDDFNRLFDATETVWLMWNGTHTLRNPWEGYSRVRRQHRRKQGVVVDTVAAADLVFIAMEVEGQTAHEPIVWYGPGAQWNAEGIQHAGHFSNILFGVHSPAGEGWYMAGGLNAFYLHKNGAGSRDTRVLRFKKSPVDYIY